MFVIPIRAIVLYGVCFLGRELYVMKFAGGTGTLIQLNYKGKPVGGIKPVHI